MPTPPFSSSHFGLLPDGREVVEWTLTSPDGLRVKILNYGGIVRSCELHSPSGEWKDVVLGMETWEQYEAGHPFFGTITGRIAGRVPGGRLEYEGRCIQLECNDGANHLHGGLQGLDKRIWSGRPFLAAGGRPALELTYLSPDGEQGYRGNMDISVTYELAVNRALRISSCVTCDEVSPVSLAHHSYFNLAGEGAGDILDHELQISADFAFDVSLAGMTPSRRLVPVGETEEDFRIPRLIREALPGIPARHGGLYQLVTHPGESPREVARLLHRPSGTGLRVLTNEPCLQVYLGTALDGSISGKSGRPYNAHAGICFECQGHPDAAGHPEIGDILVRPGETMLRETVYEFFTLQPSSP